MGNNELTTICAWCQDKTKGVAKIMQSDEDWEWGNIPEGKISHGICPECEKKLIEEANNVNSKKYQDLPLLFSPVDRQFSYPR